MGKYSRVTKYIELFEKAANPIGTFTGGGIDKNYEGPGGPALIFPHVDYEPVVDDFIRDIHHLVSTDNALGTNDYQSILNKHGIEWGTDSMMAADVTKLDAQCLVALLIAAVRADRFCEGALLDFFQAGCIMKWLKQLRDLEENK